MAIFHVNSIDITAFIQSSLDSQLNLQSLHTQRFPDVIAQIEAAQTSAPTRADSVGSLPTRARI